MDCPFTSEQMYEFGFLDWRCLDDGTVLAVAPMAFGNGRLMVDVDACGYADFYCYDGLDAALDSMRAFDHETQTEPTGWKRHGATGRRRPGGDPEKEFINM